MAYALSLAGLLLTCRHYFDPRPHAQCNSIISLYSACVLRHVCFVNKRRRRQCACACVMAERRRSAHAGEDQNNGGTLKARNPRDSLSSYIIEISGAIE